MYKQVFIMLLIVGIFSCSATIKEDNFIAQSKKIKLYDKAMLASWQQEFPNHTLNAISLTSKDNSSLLKGVHLDNHTSDDVIFLIPGNGMEVEKGGIGMMLLLAELGADIVIFDRRGLGASSGKATINNLAADANEQYQYIQSTLTANKIIVHGYSLGSFIAAQIAKTQPVHGLVLHGSATNVDDWVEAKTPWYMAPFLTVDIDENFNIVDNKVVVEKDYDGPLLIIAGENDQQVPPELSEQLYRASQSKNKVLVMVKDASHGDMLAAPATITSYVTFLTSLNKS